MSTKQATVVSCDHPDCRRQLTALTLDATKARDKVATHGWVYKGTIWSGAKDFCPEHRADAGQADWMESIIDMIREPK